MKPGHWIAVAILIGLLAVALVLALRPVTGRTPADLIAEKPPVEIAPQGECQRTPETGTRTINPFASPDECEEQGGRWVPLDVCAETRRAIAEGRPVGRMTAAECGIDLP